MTLRQHDVDSVVSVAGAARLGGIEWGTDVHIRDAESALHARAATLSAGLDILSLGSYYRAGTFGDFESVLNLASQLGAPRIRIWAGGSGSADADAEYWQAVAGDARRIADLSAERGMDIAFEYHGDTLTDSVESTLQLLHSVDRPNVGTYWQPAVGVSDQEALASLRQLVGHVSGIHCFSWMPRIERHALSDRKRLWQAVTDVLRENGRQADMMLEFVAGDLADNVLRDAGFLNHIALGE
ncbi:TIM barrel protein [Arthrobacter sp. ISL-30]|uniref:sugar phosphate isomerase/epimerase family protein n=1 Tax=Arthrobacter sp. ISL-30 TaxID=2819109 RepID=UPI0027DFACE3|nr:TIM barrel protein [Arthrobacter sp. ISL-30]